MTLMLNLSKNNNFYVSNKIVEDINFRIQETDRLTKERLRTKNDDIDKIIKINIELKKNEVNDDELEVLKRVHERIKKCESENIHYWTISNPQEPYTSTSCYWCSIKLTNYHG